jgi:hypothetical protein
MAALSRLRFQACLVREVAGGAAGNGESRNEGTLRRFREVEFT